MPPEKPSVLIILFKYLSQIREDNPMHFNSFLSKTLVLLIVSTFIGNISYAEEWYIPKAPTEATKGLIEFGTRVQLSGNEEGVLDVQELSIIPSIRLAPNDRLDIYAELPFSTIKQDQIEGFDLFEYDNEGIGDVFVQLSHKLSGDTNWQLSGVLDATAPSGENPYEHQVGIGKGYWTISPGLSAAFVTDPTILFAYVGYQHGFNKKFDDFATKEATELDPGHVIRMSTGASFSFNPRMNMSIYTALDFRGKTKYGDEEIDESDDTLARLGLSLGYKIDNSLAFKMNTVTGLNDSASDYVISIGLTYGVGIKAKS